MATNILFNELDMSSDNISETILLTRSGEVAENTVVTIRWEDVVGTLDGTITAYLYKASSAVADKPFKSAFDTAEYIVTIDTAENNENCETIIIPFYIPQIFLKYTKNGITGGKLTAEVAFLGD